MYQSALFRTGMAAVTGGFTNWGFLGSDDEIDFSRAGRW